MARPTVPEAPEEPPSVDVVGGPDFPAVAPIASVISIPERREIARAWIAGALVGIFGLEVIGSLVALWFFDTKLQELKDILILIIGPTVALIGSVLGFYFGTKEEPAEDNKRLPSTPPLIPTDREDRSP